MKKMPYFKIVLRVAVILLLAAAFPAIFYSIDRFYVLNKNNIILPEGLADSLMRAAVHSDTTGDVPISAAIVYDDSIIAIASNDVVSHRHAGGHAEINALDMALARFSYHGFMQLDRSKMYMVTTYEPCPMCAGAIVNYNIDRVVVLNRKPNDYKWEKEYKPLLKYFKRRYFQENLTLEPIHIHTKVK